MSFWDSSALVPLLVQEATSGALKQLYRSQEAVYVWWSAEVECSSAFARLGRMGELSSAEVDEANRRLDLLAKGWSVIRPRTGIRGTARRLIRSHDLRAADSLQLAAALSFGADPGFITLDDRLATAARGEGLSVIDGAAVSSESQ